MVLIHVYSHVHYGAEGGLAPIMNLIIVLNSNASLMICIMCIMGLYHIDLFRQHCITHVQLAHQRCQLWGSLSQLRFAAYLCGDSGDVREQ